MGYVFLVRMRTLVQPSSLKSALLCARTTRSPPRAFVLATPVNTDMHARAHAQPAMTSVRTLATAGTTYVTDLPRLPVPPLRQTMDTFLNTVKPFAASDADFQRISKLADELASPGGSGQQLQKLLEQRAQSKDNWLAEWWNNLAYLDYREPNALIVNPGLACRFNPFKTQDDQLRYAAKVVVGTVLTMKRFVRDEIPQERLGGQPLCMSQYQKLWSVGRIPHLDRDKLHVPPPGHEARHVIVLHNNHIFYLEVVDKEGNPLAQEHVYQLLKKIVEQSHDRAPGLGIMTTENRDTWAGVYEELTKDPKNRSNMEAILSSMCAICLDGEVADMAQSDLVRSRHVSHGNGSDVSSANRWFDKTLQFIVSRDGLFGATVEHSTCDGPPLNAACMNTLDYVENGEAVTSGPPVSEPRRLDFNLNESVLRSIEAAKVHFDKHIADFDIYRHHIPEFGQNFLRGLKISPDAFIQVAMQLAYYRQHGRPAPTYESGSIRRFLYGRTETIRSCSIASHAYCQAMVGEGVTSQQDKYRLLREAIQSHRAYTNMAVSGKGVDRHLLGLKLIAKEHSLPVPELLTDPLTEESAYWRLSTSQVMVKGSSFSFAPVVPDGYGVCYSPLADDITFSISAWRSCSGNDTRALGKNIHRALLEGKDLLSLPDSVPGSRL